VVGAGNRENSGIAKGVHRSSMRARNEEFVRSANATYRRLSPFNRADLRRRTIIEGELTQRRISAMLP